jgi:hypothetical protein
MRSRRPVDRAIKRTAKLGADGLASDVGITTSVQSLAAAEDQIFAGNKIDIWVEGRAGPF